MEWLKQGSIDVCYAVSVAMIAYKYDVNANRLVADYSKYFSTGVYEAVFVSLDTHERFMATWESASDLPFVSRFEVCGTNKKFTG